MGGRNNRRRGNTMIEFTLVGIPLVFLLISVFEMARGMWLYHTLAYSIKEGARYVIVHGQNCDPNVGDNNCQITVGNIATRIRDSGIGLLQNEFDIYLYYGNLASNPPVAVTCVHLEGCLSNTATWPVYPGNQVGQEISIVGRYPFRSALAMFWPGAGRGINFGQVWFSATSTEVIQF